MSQFVCPFCHQRPKIPLNLRCQHTPCYNCTIKNISKAQTNQFQNKYSIKCPKCMKKTITYDVKNLIIDTNRNQIQGQDYFVNSQFLEKTSTINSNHHANNNYISQTHVSRKQSDSLKSLNSLRGDHQSLHKVDHSSALCDIHQQKLKYFCYDCHNNSQKHLQSQNPLICQICLQDHNPTHDILTVAQSIDYIWKHNRYQKDKIIGYKMSLKNISEVFNHRKTQTVQYFTNLQKNIDQQYQSIQYALNNKFNDLKSKLKKYFSETVRNFNSSVENLKKSKLFLQQIEGQDLSNQNGNVLGYNKSIKFLDVYNKISKEMQNPFKLPVFQSPQQSMNILRDIQTKLNLLIQQRLFGVLQQKNMNNKQKQQLSANGEKKHLKKNSFCQQVPYKQKSTIQINLKRL